MATFENHKDMKPLEHYTALYRQTDPFEVSKRCGIPYLAEEQCFTLRFFCRDYAVHWPVFSLRGEAGSFALDHPAAQVLMLRYLLYGAMTRGTGSFLSFREMPWGEVYHRAFAGRCLNRAAMAFGSHIDSFKSMLKGLPVKWLDQGDAACQIEVLPGYEVRLILWAGDDEFPPGCQMLFSDNFPLIFSAEDRAVVGDLVIHALKRMQ